MTIFTLISNDGTADVSKAVFKSFIITALFLTTACSDAAVDQDNATKAVANRPEAIADVTKPEKIALAPNIKQQFTDAFTNAIMRKGRAAGPIAGSATSFGMSCTPADVSKSQQDFEIALPTEKKDRAHPLAVITPDGRLYELYTPYGDDVETGDIVIPSEAISWEKAAKESRIKLSADSLSGIEVGKDEPLGIFIEEGAYQFALVSSIQKDLIEANEANPAVTVFAGCVINFRK